MKTKSFLLLVALILLLPKVSFADSTEVDEEGNRARAERGNPAEQILLPGEEVTTRSGKTVKVWSTRGPVPVSRAPEPFEDREKTVIDDENIIIDAESLRRDEEHGGHHGEHHREPGEEPSR